MVKSINKMKNLHQVMGKMAVSNSHITILTLNVKGLNAPIKRHRLANWIKSQNPSGVLYPGNPSHMEGYTKAQNKGMEEDLPSKWRAKIKQELQFSSLIK